MKWLSGVLLGIFDVWVLVLAILSTLQIISLTKVFFASAAHL